MMDERLVLRFSGLPKSEAREMADGLGADATILSDPAQPSGGYGDLGTRTVAVTVSARALRTVARHLAARQQSHGEMVSEVVEIEAPDGTRRRETLTYRAAPGQSTVEAAVHALRGLPGINEALDRSLW